MEGERAMTCKQYRACLLGVLAAALICGVFVFFKYERENQIPAEGILVQQMYSEREAVV